MRVARVSSARGGARAGRTGTALVVEAGDDEAFAEPGEELLAHAGAPGRGIHRRRPTHRLDVAGHRDRGDHALVCGRRRGRRGERPADHDAVGLISAVDPVVHRAVVVDEVLGDPRAQHPQVEMRVPGHERIEGPGDVSDVARERPLALVLLEQASEPLTLQPGQHTGDVRVHRPRGGGAKKAIEAPIMRSPAYMPTT